ncbi:Hypothetical predicted protein [Cloeon dipterum]|uniref:Uncharacterized protein n=1 Tax=Cloeon dipterum TaxID=197152 RepID=A0A8S1D415_9INSE|nr:Hypothetical predicted protein [Cloeon dipterum]
MVDGLGGPRPTATDGLPAFGFGREIFHTLQAQSLVLAEYLSSSSGDSFRSTLPSWFKSRQRAWTAGPARSRRSAAAASTLQLTH